VLSVNQNIFDSVNSFYLIVITTNLISIWWGTSTIWLINVIWFWFPLWLCDVECRIRLRFLFC